MTQPLHAEKCHRTAAAIRQHIWHPSPGYSGDASLRYDSLRPGIPERDSQPICLLLPRDFKGDRKKGSPNNILGILALVAE